MKYSVYCVSTYSVEEDDCLFAEYELRNNRNEVKHKGVSLITDSKDDFLLSRDRVNMRKVYEVLNQQYDDLVSKPSCITASPLLRDLLHEAYESQSGMVFIEQEDWDESSYSDADLVQLEKEIQKYHLENVIELDPDPNSNDAVITCYGAFITEFDLQDQNPLLDKTKPPQYKNDNSKLTRSQNSNPSPMNENISFCLKNQKDELSLAVYEEKSGKLIYFNDSYKDDLEMLDADRELIHDDPHAIQYMDNNLASVLQDSPISNLRGNIQEKFDVCRLKIIDDVDSRLKSSNKDTTIQHE